VLLKTSGHSHSKSARFGLKELVGILLTVSCGQIFSTSGLQQGFARIALVKFTSQEASRGGGADCECKRTRFHAAELRFRVCKNRTYRTLQETCDMGAPCSSGQGSGALIGSLRIQALPTDHEKTRSCCCTCSYHKILCCNLPFGKIFLPKRACVRPRFKEHCAGTVFQHLCPGDPVFLTTRHNQRASLPSHHVSLPPPATAVVPNTQTTAGGRQPVGSLPQLGAPISFVVADFPPRPPFTVLCIPSIVSDPPARHSALMAAPQAFVRGSPGI